ncbi:hypothetical protein NXZ81_00655 [Klebsiella pneumoniae]|nr:hypothetical protein [Klebsiella pneumoniae]
MQALHFGAGSIGRGFIGDLLKESGYDLTFVDTNIKLNEQMQQQGGYDIYTIEKGYQLKFIPIKLALSPVTQRDEVIRQCITADIITTAVWADNLGKIAPLLLAGLQARQRAGKPKINVIVCENALFNGHILRQELLNLGKKKWIHWLPSQIPLSTGWCFPRNVMAKMLLMWGRILNWLLSARH